MAASSALSGFSITLQRGITGTPDLEYRTIAELVRITGFGLSRDVIEATHLYSDDGWKEFIYAVKVAAEFSCELNFLPTYDSHKTDLIAGVTETNANAYSTWRLLLPDYGATTATFTSSGSAITISSHGKKTGQSMTFTTSGALASGLSTGKVYWMKYATANAFSVHTNPVDAYTGSNAVATGGAGTGTHTARFPSQFSFTGACREFRLNDIDANGKLTGTATFNVTGALTTPA